MPTNKILILKKNSIENKFDVSIFYNENFVFARCCTF